MLVACGDDGPAVVPDGQLVTPDMANTCQPQSAVGSFYRRQPNPRFIAGRMFSDGKLDTAIADPDLRWDGSQWHLYYQSPHGTFATPGPTVIRRATSADLASWTFDDTPTITVSTDAGAWDTTYVGAPSITYNPDAPADRRYVLMYSGASGMFPNYGFPAFAIGVAFSADGKTFTRVPSTESPKGKAGLVLTGADAYPGAGGAVVTDPEVVYVAGTYHLWFTSLACSGLNCPPIASGIGHATSSDAIHWTIDVAPVPSLLRASADKLSGGAQPSVIYDDVHCRWEMWLASDTGPDTFDQPVDFNNTAGAWHATSTNATTWSINYSFARDFVWDQTAAGEHLGMMAGADIAMKSTGRYMAYVGFDDQNVPAGSTFPSPTSTEMVDAVMTLNVATRDAP